MLSVLPLQERRTHKRKGWRPSGEALAGKAHRFFVWHDTCLFLLYYFNLPEEYTLCIFVDYNKYLMFYFQLHNLDIESFQQASVCHTHCHTQPAPGDLYYRKTKDLITTVTLETSRAEQYWTLLRITEHYWTLHSIVEHYGTLLNIREDYWTPMNTTGFTEHYWILLQ